MRTTPVRKWIVAGILASVCAGVAGCAPAPAPAPSKSASPAQPTPSTAREDALFDGTLPRLPRAQEQIAGAVAEQVAMLKRGPLDPSFSMSTPTAEDLALQQEEDRFQTESGYTRAGMAPELAARYTSSWEKALPAAEFPSARLNAVLYQEPRIVHYEKGDTPGTGKYTVDAVVHVLAKWGAPGNRDANGDGFSVDFVGKWRLTFDEATNQVIAVSDPSVKDLAGSVDRG